MCRRRQQICRTRERNRSEKRITRWRFEGRLHRYLTEISQRDIKETWKRHERNLKMRYET